MPPKNHKRYRGLKLLAGALAALALAKSLQKRKSPRKPAGHKDLAKAKNLRDIPDDEIAVLFVADDEDPAGLSDDWVAVCHIAPDDMNPTPGVDRPGTIYIAGPDAEMQAEYAKATIKWSEYNRWIPVGLGYFVENIFELPYPETFEQFKARRESGDMRDYSEIYEEHLAEVPAVGKQIGGTFLIDLP